MKSFLIVAALLLSPFLSPPAAAEILEKVVVAVNGDIVTLSEFEGRQLAAVQGAQIAPEQIRGFLQQNNARLLQEAIDEMLIVQRGEELGFKVPPEALDQIIEERITKENNIQSDAQLQQQLRREGMTLDDLKRQIERSIVHRQVLASDIPQPALTEAEMREYYETHLDDYARPASVNLQEIFISSTHPDAILRAQEMADRARDGEDFSVLARTNSDAPSAENGGDLGTLVLGEINPDIERVATALPPGG
ncbi:MAG TPA: peptidylprolyl isomerase, partial [Candidatus Krumholzibacteria bacterium]